MEDPPPRVIRNFVYKSLINRILKKEIKSLDPKSILDVGCGPGRFLFLYKDIEKVTCVDFSKAMLKRVKDQAKKLGLRNIDFEEGACEDLKIKDNSFELVLVINVLLHILPNKIKKAISELIRVSKYYIIIIDYYSKKRKKLAYWCFLHNYPAMFKNHNVELAREYKIPFFSQKCFIFKK